jgi:hypothetical protein
MGFNGLSALKFPHKRQISAVWFVGAPRRFIWGSATGWQTGIVGLPPFCRSARLAMDGTPKRFKQGKFDA